MIDYLFRAVDQNTLVQAIPSYYDPISGWDMNRCFPCQVTDNTDPNNPVLLTDYHLWVSASEFDSTLTANSACILAANRDTSEIIYATLTEQQMAVYTISPVILGSNYPFGSPQEV